MQKTQDSKSRPARPRKLMLVRYGRMNNLGLFDHNEARIPATPVRVVVKTDKGLEMGCIVGQLTCYRAGQLKFSSDQVKKYYERSGIEFNGRTTGKFVRFATAEDLSEERHLKKLAEEEIASCRRFVKELGLDMKIVDAEHIFGGERVVFYFMSEGRVDFRELVKKIAHEYQTRIEMRQIGSRDEAKLLGDLESCGQQCCCQRFLKLLKPVNMRMAKMQKATLDPSKISGYCGRLKCCLRYEDETYTQLKKRLPKKNTRVRSEKGEGRVVNTQILTQLVVVEYDGGEREAVNLEELEILGPGERGGPRKPENEQDRRSRKDDRGKGSRPERKPRPQDKPSDYGLDDGDESEDTSDTDAENGADIENGSADEQLSADTSAPDGNADNTDSASENSGQDNDDRPADVDKDTSKDSGDSRKSDDNRRSNRGRRRGGRRGGKKGGRGGRRPRRRNDRNRSGDKSGPAPSGNKNES